MINGYGLESTRQTWGLKKVQTQERLKWFQSPQSLVKSHHLQSSCLEVAVTRMHSLNLINFMGRLYNYSCINELVSFLWRRQEVHHTEDWHHFFFYQPADSFLSDMMICHYLTIFHITGSIYSKNDHGKQFLSSGQPHNVHYRFIIFLLVLVKLLLTTIAPPLLL